MGMLLLNSDEIVRLEDKLTKEKNDVLKNEIDNIYQQYRVFIQHKIFIDSKVMNEVILPKLREYIPAVSNNK
jgi:hypothetical protein